MAKINLLKNVKKAKVDGLIVVDLPWPENRDFSKKCKKNSINFVQLVSPTTSKYRMERIVKDSHDMIYYISMLSTTGGKLKVSSKKILKNYNKIKKINKSKNIVIGFGITSKTIASLKRADGLVVGSAICKEISNSIKNRQNPVTNVTNIVTRLRKKNIMNWIKKTLRFGEKVKKLLKKRPTKEEIESSDWTSCCKGPILKKELEDNLFVCPSCNKHHRINCRQRFDIVFGKNNYEVLETPRPQDDPLQFPDYKDKLKIARKKTGQDSAVMIVKTKVKNIDITAGAFDFAFIGASVGAAEGEAIIYGIQHAIDSQNSFCFIYIWRWDEDV